MLLNLQRCRTVVAALLIAAGFSGCSKNSEAEKPKETSGQTNKVAAPVVPTEQTNLVVQPGANAPTQAILPSTEQTVPKLVEPPAKANSEHEQWFQQGVAALEQKPLPDLQGAAKLFRQGAEAGHAPSQQALGVLYLNGDGVQKDVQEGIRLIRASADQNFAEAQFKLASLYARGIGVETNLNKAAEFALRAAEQGHAEAQYNVATMLMIGKGLPENLPEAAKWLHKASDAGHPTAQSNLGVLYANGRGVETNLVEAVKWFRAAAEQGQPTAQYNLAQALQDGKGADADLIEAYKWYSLAAELGDRDASEAMIELSIKLPASDVAEALKRARSFKAKRRLTPSGF